MMVSVDLHIHTEFSSDGLMSPHRLIQICQKRGLGALAVTDHNVIEGAFRVAEIAPFPVIIGEEIRSTDGEVIGLFLNKEIPRDLSIEKTIELIRDQGGLVYLPHPCDRLRRSRIRPEKLADVAPMCDIIEVFNARNVFGQDNMEAEKLAVSLDLAQGVGSDAHSVMEIGHCYLEMDFDPKGKPTDFLAALRKAEKVVKKSPLVVHGISKTAKVWSQFGGSVQAK